MPPRKKKAKAPSSPDESKPAAKRGRKAKVPISEPEPEKEVESVPESKTGDEIVESETSREPVSSAHDEHVPLQSFRALHESDKVAETNAQIVLNEPIAESKLLDANVVSIALNRYQT